MSSPDVALEPVAAPQGARRPGPPRASWLSATMLLGPLSLLAELLIERTHHRPLGAATFATCAVLLWGLAELTSRRLLDPTVCASRAQARRVAWIVSATFSVAIVVRAVL
jgi:hypothetical protein